MPPKVQTKNQSTPVVSGAMQTRRREPDKCIDVSGLSEEVKVIVAVLTDKLDRIIDRMNEKDKKIDKLEIENATLRRDLTRMGERLDDMENNERKNDIIVSGDIVPVASVGENTSNISVELLRRHISYSLPPDAVLAAYRLGSRPATQAPDRRNILLKLKTQELKRDIMQACRTSKPPGLYIRESLTPTRSKILFSLRQLKKRCPDRIDYCGTRDGKVFIWTRAVDGRGTNKKLYINSLNVLCKLCSDEFGVDYTELSGRSDHQ